VIYDSYVEYEYQKELQDEQERLAKLSDPKRTVKRLLPDKKMDENREFEDKFLRAARTLERMVVQNIYSDIALGKDQFYWLGDLKREKNYQYSIKYFFTN
jgi:hypothetical protein